MNKWYVMNVILSDHFLIALLVTYFEGMYRKSDFSIDASLMNLSLPFLRVATRGQWRLVILNTRTAMTKSI